MDLYELFSAKFSREKIKLACHDLKPVYNLSNAKLKSHNITLHVEVISKIKKYG